MGDLKLTVQGGEEKTAQPGQPLTNDSILKLVKAGLSEDTIISMVKTFCSESGSGM